MVERGIGAERYMARLAHRWPHINVMLVRIGLHPVTQGLRSGLMGGNERNGSTMIVVAHHGPKEES